MPLECGHALVKGISLLPELGVAGKRWFPCLYELCTGGSTAWRRLGPVDSHDAATTPATGRAPPRSFPPSCRTASRSPAAPWSPRGNSPPDAATRTSPGHGPGAPSGSAATGSPPPPRVPPAASPRRTPCRPQGPRRQGRPGAWNCIAQYEKGATGWPHLPVVSARCGQLDVQPRRVRSVEGSIHL